MSEITSQTTNLDEQTYAKIIDAAEAAYSDVADEYPSYYSRENVHRLGTCVLVCRQMYNDLRGEYQIQPMYNTRLAGGNHVYLGLTTDTSSELVRVDPTWQQFIAQRFRTPLTPRILIGSTDEIIPIARAHGMEDYELEGYAPSSSHPISAQAARFE